MRVTVLLLLALALLATSSMAIEISADRAVLAEFGSTAESELAFEVELEAQIQWSLKSALQKVGTAIKKTVAVVKQAVVTVVKKVVTVVKKAAAKVAEFLFDPSIKIGAPISEVKNFDNDVAHDLMRMSSLAYCKKEQIAAWKCQDCGRWKLFGRYEANSAKSTQSVVVGDTAKNNIYVSFRGTMGTLQQWMGNLDFKKQTWSDCSGCKVHHGFYSTHNMVRDQTLANLKKAVAAMPRADIYVTGHSMGGAVATLFSMYLHAHHPTMAPTQMYNIGCPRVGNDEFSTKLDQYFKDNHYRIKNQKDIVPDVPLKKMGFRHTGTLVLCADGTATCFAGRRKQENPGHFEFLQILANVAKAMVAHGRYLLTGIGSGKYQC